jgi:hypothetical protein
MRRVETRQVYRSAFFLGELGAYDEGSVVEPFTDQFRAQPVGGGL